MDQQQTSIFGEGEPYYDPERPGIFKFPEELYIPPLDFPKQNSNSTLWNWILRKFM
jgi:hypothetical protein